MTNHPIPTGFITVEKFWLALILTLMMGGILILERMLDTPSSAIAVMAALVGYGMIIGVANIQQRRLLKRGFKSVDPPPDLAAWDWDCPMVSIVVPAHNEATVIGSTVKNILALDYPDFELWVVDDRSQDQTLSELKRLKAELNDPRFHVLERQPNALPGKSAVLNEAFEQLTGEFVLVIDADGRLEPDFLKKVVPAMLDESVGAVQVRKMIANERVNLLTRCQAIEYAMDAQIQDGRDAIKGAVELRGNGQLVRREALESVDGWTEDSITDDLDLSTKLHLAGWDIRFLPDAVVREEGVVRFVSLLRQRRRWAEGSLKRYLAYGLNIIASSRVSRRAQIDMLFYFLQFVFPLWLTFDWVVQGLEWIIFGQPKHLLSSSMALPLFGLALAGTCYVAQMRFESPNPFKAVAEALMTGVFLVVVWIPVVLWITFKVMFRPDQGAYNWGKTPRAQTYATPNDMGPPSST